MVISKTPFRISFFGGGTDLPEWYKENSGAVLSSTIDKYVYISSRYLPEFFVLIVFLLILSMPVIILLRKKLYGIVPDFVKDSFLEIDQQIENKNKQKKN